MKKLFWATCILIPPVPQRLLTLEISLDSEELGSVPTIGDINIGVITKVLEKHFGSKVSIYDLVDSTYSVSPPSIVSRVKVIRVSENK